MDAACKGCGKSETTGWTFQQCLVCEGHLCDDCKPAWMAAAAPHDNPRRGLCSEACFRRGRPATWQRLHGEPRGAPLTAWEWTDKMLQAIYHPEPEAGPQPHVVLDDGTKVYPWWAAVGHLVATGR